jgi:hypothetical protein
MNFLDWTECARWSAAHGYPVVEPDGHGRAGPAVPKDFRELRLGYPKDSGRKVALARTVISALLRTEGLLWVGDWGVWPSSEHMPLFMRFRAALGEHRPLIQAPGHVVTAVEPDDAISVLAMSLFFFWDCHLLTAEPGPLFVCSHDEWASIFLPAGHDADKMGDRFSSWEPSLIDAL